MWFSTISFIGGILIGTSALAANLPKTPQSPAPSADPVKMSAASPRPKVTALGAITTEVEGDLTIVTARLNKIPDWKEVPLEEHGTFLQIKLPQTQIPASGEFIDGNGPFLRKLATFQLPDEDGALRLFVNQDAGKAKLATTAELLGDRLIITIDHKKLEQLIAPQTAKQETAADIIAKTSVEKNAPAPSDLINTAPKAETQASSEISGMPNLAPQLMKVAAFCAVMFLGLIAAHWARARRIKKSRGSFDRPGPEPVSLKVLSSVNIGPKQKLTLVQVGDQQILIGVSADAINMITTVESKPRQTSFARQLDAANPNADIRLKSAEDIAPSRPQRRPVTTSTTHSRSDNPVKGSRINVGVGDDGAQNMKTPASQNDGDITKILRDRLRNLPPG
jgi:flagellar biogenesis protein FliO